MTIVEGKLRAIDLSMGWAGPLVGEMLAEMGVQVIKIEDTLHFDWWRGSLSMGPPELQVIERAAPFNTTNRGKLGVTLDLSNPRGLEIVKRLVATADILIENFSPDVMERLGLSWKVLQPLNPRLIMISMPSFGSQGPERNARGYGNTIEAVAGITGLMGYHDGGQPYTMSNALGDPVSGLNGLFAVLVRTSRARGNRTRAAYRTGASRRHDSADRRGDRRVSGHRQGAAASRQSASGSRAARDLPMRRLWLDRDRGGVRRPMA